MKLLLFINLGRKSSLPLTATGHQLFVRRIDLNRSTLKYALIKAHEKTGEFNE
jgi:hypothetical protein